MTMKRTWMILKFGLGVTLSLVSTSRESLAQGGALRSETQHPTSDIQNIGIDRLVAVVNETPITESDLLWFLALDAEAPAGSFSDEMKRSALRQFIDQELLYQEAEKLPSIEVKPEEINQYISELIHRFPSESTFRRRLDAVGLDQTTLQQIVQRRLVILQFMEFRFRAFVFVTDPEIQ